MSVVSFAEAVEPRMVELRAELLREIRATLLAFERHRRDEDRGRLLGLLDALALLIRAEPTEV